MQLCEHHAEEERATFARSSRRLGSKDDRERIAGLEEIAQLTLAHVNAPSRRVVERLATALDDDSHPVRTRATQLLGPPQNALAALSALLKAFRSAEGERGRLEKERGKLSHKQMGPSKLREGQLEELERREAELEQQTRALLDWRAELLAQLARFPDDRVVETILELAPRSLALGGNEALLQLGSRKALEGVVESVRVWEEELVFMEEQAARAQEGSAGLQDTVMRTIAEEWAKVCRTVLEQAQAEGSTVQSRLDAFVSEHYGTAPAVSNRPYEGWKRWLAEHREGLPEHLAGVSSPVW